jgi:hypothetical protein
MAGFETLAIAAALGAASQALGAAQADRRARAEAQAHTNAAAQQLQQQAQAAEIEERRRREQLARERAQRLARLGAQGLASAGGSSDAVLGGLTAESTRQGAESQRLRSLAMSSSLLDLADRNRLTLLRAAEAREKAALGLAGAGLDVWNKLDRLAPSASADSGVGFKAPPRR